MHSERGKYQRVGDATDAIPELRDRNGGLVRFVKEGTLSLVSCRIRDIYRPIAKMRQSNPGLPAGELADACFARVNPFFYTASHMQCTEVRHEKRHLAAPACG